MSNPLISLRLDDALLADLDHEAGIAGIERAEFVRQALAAAIHTAAVTRLARRVSEPSDVMPDRWSMQQCHGQRNKISGATPREIAEGRRS